MAKSKTRPPIQHAVAHEAGLPGLLTPLRSHPVRAVLLALAVCVSIFLKYDEWTHGGSDEIANSDAYAYNAEAVKAVTEGKPIPAYYNPLETLYLVSVYKMFGVNLRLAKAIQILFSFLLPWFFWRAGRTLFSEEAGFWAALFALVHPFPAYYAAHSWVEFWLIFIVAALIWLHAKSATEASGPLNAFASGLLGGIGALAKLWILPFSIILSAFWIRRAARSGGRIRFAALAGLLWLLGAALPLGPWIGYASHHEGRFVPINTNSAVNFFLGNNPQARIGYTSAALPDMSVIKGMHLPEGPCAALMTEGPEHLREVYAQKCMVAYSWAFLKMNPRWLWNKLQSFTILWALPNSEYYQRGSRKLIYLHGHMAALGLFWTLSLVGFAVSIKRWRSFVPFYLGSILIWVTFAVTFYLARFKVGAAPLEILFASGGMAAVEYGLARFQKI